MSQLTSINQIVAALKTNNSILTYAQNIATAIVDGPANHCAATLSSLLVFAGIYPKGGGTGNGDLEPWVPSLAYDLENRRGWTRINLGTQIYSGDVGVVLIDDATHHIYLVIDPTDQASPLIADNQAATLHSRAVAGDPAHSYSPTTYFLRAPT